MGKSIKPLSFAKTMETPPLGLVGRAWLVAITSGAYLGFYLVIWHQAESVTPCTQRLPPEWTKSKQRCTIFGVSAPRQAVFCSVHDRLPIKSFKGKGSSNRKQNLKHRVIQAIMPRALQTSIPLFLMAIISAGLLSLYECCAFPHLRKRDDLVKAAVGQHSFGGATYYTVSQSLVGLLPPGADGVNHGKRVY